MSWVEVCSFFVHGEPKPWRPSTVVTTTAGVRMAYPGHGKTEKGRSWQAEVLATALDNQLKQPLEGPVKLDMTFYVPRPQRLNRKKDPMKWLPCDKNPDRSNYGKLLEDLLQPNPRIGFVGFYKNDAQICDGVTRKRYHQKGGRPGAMVVISKWEES